MLRREWCFPTYVVFVVSLIVFNPIVFASDADAEPSVNADYLTDFSVALESSVQPDPPRNLTLIPGSDYVDVFWEPPAYDGGSPIVTYDVLRGTGTEYEGGYGISLTVLATVDSSILAYRDVQVDFGDVFYYAVRARNDFDHGYSTVPKWARVGGSVPGAPMNLSATAGSFQVEVTWTPPVDPGGTEVSEYRVYRGNTSGNETYLCTVKAAPLPYPAEPECPIEFNDVGLTNGKHYYYGISAVNSLGEGPMSGSKSARPNFAPFAYVTTGKSSNGRLSVTLHWSPPAENQSEVVGYKIYYQDYWLPGATWNCLATVSNHTLSFDDRVSECLGRLYRVAAVYSGGDEVFSEITDRYWPMCEGSDFLLVSEIVAISLFILGLIVVPLLIVLKRRN
jgi:hypothetical protein